jgi:hypothetical protein
VVSLWDVSASFVVDGEADAGDAVGSQAGAPVEASVTIVEIPLEDLTGAPHAIVVQASVDAQPIVCGDLGGVMLGTDELPIALAPVGSSTWSGIALLDAASDGTTSVSLYLFEGAVSGSGLVGDDDDDGDDDRDDDDNPRGDDDGDDDDGDDGEDDRGDDD